MNESRAIDLIVKLKSCYRKVVGSRGKEFACCSSALLMLPLLCLDRETDKGINWST